MGLIVGALGLILLSGIFALYCWRSSVWAMRMAAFGTVAGSLLAAVPVWNVLGQASSVSFRVAWPVPGGDFAVGLDPLSAFFLTPVLVLAALASIYGSTYMLPYARHRSLAKSAFAFNLLIASMILVLIARNGLLFMLAWE